MLEDDATNDSVHLVATIPPPPGESDVYSAATRVQPAPLADMAALLDCGETAEGEAEGDVEGEVEIDVQPVPQLGDHVLDAGIDHGAVPETSPMGTSREWLMVVGLAVVGASAVFAVSIAL